MIKEFNTYINEGILGNRLKVGDYVIFNPPEEESGFLIYGYKGKIGKIISTKFINENRVHVKFNHSISLRWKGVLEKRNIFFIKSEQLTKTTKKEDIEQYKMEEDLHRLGII